MTATHEGPAPTAAAAGGDFPAERLPIHIGGEAESIRALTTVLSEGGLPDVYVAAGQLVHLSRVSGTADQTAPPTVTAEPLTAAALAWLLAHHTYCYRLREDKSGDEEEKKVEGSPTKSALAAVLSQRYWPNVRPLTGIVGAPVLRPDGSLLATEGYDPATGLYYAPTVHMPPIPTNPTAAEVTEAREFVLGKLLRDFPFVAEADRANHLGLMLAPILRPFLGCLVPFGLISATTQSSGKTLLAEVIGHLYGSKSLVWRKGDDTELEKSVTSALHSSAPIMLWDNIKEGSEVSSPVLAQLLTSPEWSARMLGSSGAGFTAANDRVWLATGNNLRIGGDMSTRTVLIRLDPNDPHPDQRDQNQFGIPDLGGWLKSPAHRVTVLRHLLILVLDWIAAGAARTGHTMRQFTSWAQATGGLLAHHGIHGFLDNLDDLREADDEDIEWAAFLARWWELNSNHRMSATKLRHQAEIEPGPGAPVDRWEGAFLTDDAGRIPSAKSLGRTLKGHVGRWHSGYVLRSARDNHANANVFWVEIEQAETEDTDQQPGQGAGPEQTSLC